MLGDVARALHSGFVECELLSATPPTIRIRLMDGECTALVRHALLASIWTKRATVITSWVHLCMEGNEILVVLGHREATQADRPAVMGATQPDAPRDATGDAPRDGPCTEPAITLPAMRKSTPIAELCARRGHRPEITCVVAFKCAPIPFKNGTGEMVAFELQDESGKIRAVSFSPECHELDVRMRIGGRYRISGGRCKKADPRFSEHEFELVLDSSACVSELRD